MRLFMIIDRMTNLSEVVEPEGVIIPGVGQEKRLVARIAGAMIFEI